MRLSPYMGLMVSLAVIALSVSGASSYFLVSSTAMPYLIWTTYVVFGLSLTFVVVQLIAVPSSGRLATEGFYLSAALALAGVLGGIGGILGKLDSDLGFLDVELTIVPVDPSETFIASVILLPIFQVLRMFSEALEAHLAKANRKP